MSIKKYIREEIKQQVRHQLDEKTVPFSSVPSDIRKHFSELLNLFLAAKKTGKFDTTKFLDPLGNLTQLLMRARGLRETQLKTKRKLKNK